MFGDCATATTQVEILDRGGWSDHLAEAHGLTCYWSAGPSAITPHYSTHLTVTLDSARRFGYSEVRSEVHRNLVLSVRLPWLCISCLHDYALPADQRLCHANQITLHVN